MPRCTVQAASAGLQLRHAHCLPCLVSRPAASPQLLLPASTPCSQWSWPINLPVQFFGIFPTGVLRSDATDTPWAEEIEQKVGQGVLAGERGRHHFAEMGPIPLSVPGLQAATHAQHSSSCL